MRSPNLDILVVDPSDAWRLATVEALRAAGFTVSSRDTCLGLTYTLLVRPAKLVLVDLDLPWLYGERAVRLVHGERSLARTKIALVSEKSPELVRRAVVALGADGGVSKHEGEAAVRALVERLIGARAPLSATA